MTDTATDHAALLAKIRQAHDEWRDALRAFCDTPERHEDFPARMTDFHAASGYYRGLVHAGLILTLGNGEDD
jgi:hypothetical protein